MRTFQEWTLLVMFGILHCVTGHLHEPLNITIESRKFSLFLTWLPAPEYPPDVTYIVEYMLYGEKRWRVVRKCNGTSATQCDLTCALRQNYTNQHALQVRAVSASHGKSAWASLHNITYMFSVEPSPPILEIIPGEGTVSINTSLQTPPCMPSNLRIYLKYLLEIRNINNPAEQIRKIEMMGPSKTIKTDGYEGEYCMAAKTIYAVDNKISRPSDFFCFTFSQKDENPQLMALLGLLVLLPAVFIVALIIWNKTNERARTPKVLDFSQKRCALAVSLICKENPYPLTIHENMDQSSSAKYLLSGKDSDGINDYSLNGCGYTERMTTQSNSSGRDTLYRVSTSNEYMSSQGVPTNSNSDKSSDSSCVQTSGSNTAVALMLDKLQLHNLSEEINTNVSEEMETLGIDIITMGPLLDTLRVSDSNGFEGVLLNTLSLEAATDLCLDNQFYDSHLTDSEDSHEQLTNNCTDCDMPNPFVESQSLQQNLNSGYMLRK